MGPTYRLLEADDAASFDAARELIKEYAAELGASMQVDLGFQGIAAELAHLPQMYGPPTGCLVLANRDRDWVGCCALRRFSDGVCEMKRLYIRPEQRGSALGRQLTTRVISKARSLGYRRMVLDTLNGMIAAQMLYRSLGFRDTKPYYSNPIDRVCYMDLDLDAS